VKNIKIHAAHALPPSNAIGERNAKTTQGSSNTTQTNSKTLIKSSEPFSDSVSALAPRNENQGIA